MGRRARRGARARELERRFAGTNVRVVHADATRLRWPDEAFKVVASVPFDRTTAILRRLFNDPSTPLVAAELVVQWELAAKRAAVWPSTLTGVYWGAWYRFALVRRLPPCAFAPEPAVAAGVLRVERRAEPLVAPRDRAAWRAFVKRGFAAGRPLVTRLVFNASAVIWAFLPMRGQALSTRCSG